MEDGWRMMRLCAILMTSSINTRSVTIFSMPNLASLPKSDGRLIVLGIHTLRLLYSTCLALSSKALSVSMIDIFMIAKMGLYSNSIGLLFLIQMVASMVVWWLKLDTSCMKSMTWGVRVLKELQTTSADCRQTWESFIRRTSCLDS